MGWSMGGSGTWRLAQLYPDRFAAAATFCGQSTNELLDNLRNLPMLVVHGSDDSVVQVSYDRQATAYLENLGYPVRYEEYHGVDHNVWPSWIGDDGPRKVFEHFSRYNRNPYPQEVVIKATQIDYATQYWVEIEAFASDTEPAHLRARILGPQALKVETSNVGSFQLDLEHPELRNDGPVELQIDGANLQVEGGAQMTRFVKTAEGWRQ